MIRFATREDIPSIMQFIDAHWKKGHILATNRSFFEYEFVYGDTVNFVVSENEQGKLDGIEGFLVYAKKNRFVFPVVWKVIQNANPMLGVEILQYIRENTDACCIASPGINPKTIGIYHFLGIATGLMTQWYRLNKRDKYEIALVENREIPGVTREKGKLVYLDSFQELSEVFNFQEYYDSHPKPCKEEWYIEKRYFHHPIYQYRVYGISTEGKIDALLVFRVQEYQSQRALRLVDVIGEYSRLYDVTWDIDRLMVELDVEYVDLYETGLSKKNLEQAGWLTVKNSGNIIPNYFYPFVQKNIDIYYMSQDSDIVLFKADGDQDRPN